MHRLRGRHRRLPRSNHAFLPRRRGGHAHRTSGAAVCLRSHAADGIFNLCQPIISVSRLSPGRDAAGQLPQRAVICPAHSPAAAHAGSCRCGNEPAGRRSSDLRRLAAVPDLVLPAQAAVMYARSQQGGRPLPRVYVLGSAPKYAAFRSPQALRASVPTPFGPTGHFPLIGGIDPLRPWGALVAAKTAPAGGPGLF